MIDPNDLAIEPNDDDIADEYWDDVPEQDDDFEIPDDLETHQL
jgi:hypothetical protein